MSEGDSVASSECGKSADGVRGSKRHSGQEAENVHSANDWEHVDLGDEGRKNKFLRLMGANKKEHHGRIVIGEKKTAVVRGRSHEDNARLNADLEDQYRHGLDMKMSGCARRHTGLGFSEPEPPPAASETSSEAGTDVAECADGDGDLGVPVVNTEEKSSEVQETDAKGQKDSSDKSTKPSDFKKPPMVGFVESSAS